MDQITTVSSVFSRFGDHIGTALGILASEVIEFIKFIDAHPQLLALSQIAENLCHILPALEKIVTDELDADKLGVWLQICEYIITQPSELITHFPDIAISSDNGKQKPFAKLYEKYPLYITLWFRHPAAELQNRYLLLQTHLLLTQHHFRWLTETADKKYESTTNESTRLIRQFADASKPEKVEELRQLLEMLPDVPVPMEAFLQWVEELEADDSFYPEPYGKSINILRRMLWYANEHRGGFSRRNSRTWQAILSREAIRTPIIAKDEDGRAINFAIEAVHMPSQSEDEEKAAKRAGCAPGEVKSGIEHLIISDEFETGQSNLSPLAGRSPVSHIRRTREKYQAIALTNQLLPTRWETLSLHEVALLLKEISDLVRYPDKRRKYQYSDKVCNAELAALLTAIYWTGNPLKTVIGYRFCLSREKLPKSLEPTDHRYIIDSDEWAHGSLSPDYRTTLSSKTKKHLYDIQHHVILHTQNKTNFIMQQWLRGYKELHDRKYKSKMLFGLDYETYQQPVDCFLKTINKKYKTRLTKTRIATDLFHRLYRYSGDVVESMLITGQGHYLGMVPLHYSSPSLHRLQEVYSNTCQNIIQAVYLELSKPVKEAAPNNKWLSTEKAMQIHAGGRHYLKTGHVAQLVVDLRARFKKCLKFAGFNDYLVELHNDYTIYVAEMLGFITGYRAVRDPLDALSQLDWETGFACISDKDDEDFYNARLVWIPPLCLQQLRYYQRHCQLLAERLILINPRLAIQLFAHGDLVDSPVPFLFLLQSNGRLLNLRPTEIERRLRDVFPVPVNVNRSYLRNRLRELSCPAEIVNYFMGHWENGEEPFGIYSTLSPDDFKRAISEPLLRILELDGWKVLEGLGRA
jgi:hypothetical protein